MDDSDVYDGYVQADAAGELKDISILKLCSGYTNAFVIESNEFDRCVDVKELKLVDGKVFVIWTWNLWDTSVEEGTNEAENTSGTEDSSQVDEAGVFERHRKYTFRE